METRSPQVPSALRPKQPNFPMKLKINASGKYQKIFISKAAETLGLSQHELLKDLQKFQSDSMIRLCIKGFFFFWITEIFLESYLETAPSELPYFSGFWIETFSIWHPHFQPSSCKVCFKSDIIVILVEFQHFWKRYNP